MIVVEGPGAPEGFASGVAERLGAELVKPAYKVFPDGESYVRLPGGLEGTVVVVQSMYPMQDKRLVEALLLAEAAYGAGASRVILVAPYMAYARQDKRFLEGEPISIKAVLKALGSAGYDALVTIDIHKPESLAYFPGRAVDATAVPQLAEAVSRAISGEGGVVVVAPDKGALARARMMAGILGAEYDYLEKHRDRYTGEVTYRPKTVDVQGKTVVIVDDMVSTGGTMAKAASMLRGLGASRVIAACTHGLFIGGALERLRRAGVEEVYAANTVPLPKEGVRAVDASPAAVESLRELL